MNLEKIKVELKDFLRENTPLAPTAREYFIVIRTNRLILIKATELRIGDVRLLQLPVEELVKGLSNYQWNTLVRKYATLHLFVEAKKNKEFLKEQFERSDLGNGTNSGK